MCSEQTVCTNLVDPPRKIGTSKTVATAVSVMVDDPPWTIKTSTTISTISFKSSWTVITVHDSPTLFFGKLLIYLLSKLVCRSRGIDAKVVSIKILRKEALEI